MNAAAASPESSGNVIDLRAALSERYLAYALSTITARSLPDVRDGLKPVQRRIVYAMLQLRLDPSSGFKKCARVVGDVIGRYHPHGDAAVYDALVRLAQDFAHRYPLVDGQGNFGNIDGDNAAAMRYTESRLTEVAMALLEGIDEDTVEFRANYDGSEREPLVLPAAFPNLLANGSAGIAVGMATNIPPHNAAEILRALIFMLERPSDARLPETRELLHYIKGPDLPTGGVLIETQDNLEQAYATGRGSFRHRARWEVEKLPHGQYQIIVTEIPYQVQKSRLVERLAELLAARKLPLLADLQDESTEETRLVLIPRSRSVEPESLMEHLFRQSELEVRLSLNMNVLDAAGIPRVMSLADVLHAFILHRMDVLVRRSQHRLEKVEDRLEILDGYLKAFLDIDEVIRIVREEDEPKTELMRVFELSERQAEAILNLRLRNLRRLEEIEIKKERTGLRKERAELRALLQDEGLRRTHLKEQMQEGVERFGKEPRGGRLTSFGEASAHDANILELPVERSPVTVVCSRNGWIRAIKGHVQDGSEIKYKEGDTEGFVLKATTADKLLAVSRLGRCYVIAVDKLPSGRGMGEPINLLIDLAAGSDLIGLCVHDHEGELIFSTRQGRGFRAREGDIAAQTRTGRHVVNLAEGDSLQAVRPVQGDHIAVIGSNNRLLVFKLSELPQMNRGRGVILQRYREGYLEDLISFDLEQGLSWSAGQRTRTQKDVTTWLGVRGGSGRMAPPGFSKSRRM